MRKWLFGVVRGIDGGVFDGVDSVVVGGVVSEVLTAVPSSRKINPVLHYLPPPSLTPTTTHH